MGASARPGSAGLNGQHQSNRGAVGQPRPDNWIERLSDMAGSSGRSAGVAFIERLGMKPDSPVSTALLQHYVEGSGTPYELTEVPAAWKEWIVRTVGRRQGRHRMHPYNAGLYDLTHGLGHFDVTVRARPDGSTEYEISDTYMFGAQRHDRKQRGRHGFTLGDSSSWKVGLLEEMLPDDEYRNPGGFTERWEVRRTGGKATLFIPQQFLERNGKPFRVKGRFVVPAPAASVTGVLDGKAAQARADD
jgi:hypothetical protein